MCFPPLEQEELLREIGNQGSQMSPEMMLMRRETEKLRNDLKQEMVIDLLSPETAAGAETAAGGGAHD